jgi:hypothetical protein
VSSETSGSEMRADLVCESGGVNGVEVAPAAICPHRSAPSLGKIVSARHLVHVTKSSTGRPSG